MNSNVYQLSAKTPVVVTALASKGGTGKTTVINNLAGLLSDFGNKVLIIDTDPQASCSQFYVPKGAANGMVQLLAQGGADVDESFISKTNIDELDIIMSDFPNREGGSIVARFGERDDSAYCLSQTVAAPALQVYDYILIDTQGAVGKVQRAAVYAADILISPFMPSAMDVGALLENTIPMLQSMSATSSLMGLSMPGRVLALGNKVSSTAAARIMLDYAREILSTHTGISLAVNVLKDSTHFHKNLMANTPVHRVDKGASEMMHQLLWELFPNYAGQYANDWQKEVKRAQSKGAR